MAGAWPDSAQLLSHYPALAVSHAKFWQTSSATLSCILHDDVYQCKVSPQWALIFNNYNEYILLRHLPIGLSSPNPGQYRRLGVSFVHDLGHWKLLLWGSIWSFRGLLHHLHCHCVSLSCFLTLEHEQLLFRIFCLIMFALCHCCKGKRPTRDNQKVMALCACLPLTILAIPFWFVYLCFAPRK